MEQPQQPPPQTVLPQPQVQPNVQPQPAQPMMMYQPQYKPPQFRRLKARHSLFKVGAGLLFLSTVVFIVGFSAPAWLDNTGLWMTCTYKCISNTGSGSDWFNAVRAMETISLVFFLLSVGMLLYQDVFKTPPPPENKAVEILAVLAGVCGLIGSAIFGAKVQLARKVYYDYFNGQNMVYNNYSHTLYMYLQWGYGLATGAAILVLVSAVLLAYSRHNHAAYTAQRAAMAGVSLAAPAPSQAFAPPMAMAPMHPQTVMTPAAGYAYPVPPAYPQPYPYPYPMPPATAVVSPPPAAQGPMGSQVPVAYVMNQGRIIPVYEATAATTTTVAEDGTTTNRL